MTTPDIIIRKFQISDYDAVVALWNEVHLPYKPGGRDTVEKIAQELHRDSAVFLVAEVKRKIIGAVFGTHDGRKGWINRLVVSTQYQQKGLGQRLIRAVESRLENMGIEIVACLVDEANAESMRFFSQAGYTEHRDIIYFAKKKYPEV